MEITTTYDTHAQITRTWISSDLNLKLKLTPTKSSQTFYHDVNFIRWEFIDQSKAWSFGIIKSWNDDVSNFNTYPVIQGIAFKDDQYISFFETQELVYSIMEKDSVILNLPKSFEFISGINSLENFWSKVNEIDNRFLFPLNVMI